MIKWLSPGAVRLTANLSRRPELGDSLQDLLGLVLPTIGSHEQNEEFLVLSQGPRDWIVFCDAPLDLCKKLEAIPNIIATNAALAEFKIDRDQLANGTSVTLATGEVCVTRFAHIRATLLAETQHIRLFVEKYVAEYVMAWLARPSTKRL